MSSLACVCGYIIHDDSDNLPNKATFIKDKDFEQYLDDGQNIVKGAIESIENGTSSHWLQENSFQINGLISRHYVAPAQS